MARIEDNSAYAKIPTGYLSKKNIHGYLRTGLARDVLLGVLDTSEVPTVEVEYVVSNNTQTRKCYLVAGVYQALKAFEATASTPIAEVWESSWYPGRKLKKINWEMLNKVYHG